MRIVLQVTILLYSVGQGQPQVQGCVSQPTCTKCLMSPGCAWCKDIKFLKTWESSKRRCDTQESLKSRGCAHPINPSAVQEDQKNNDLSSDKQNVVQLQPQNLHFKLRVGVPQTFNVLFKRAQGYPIDLYYLMDLSFSMRDDLDTIKNLGEDILKTLKKFTESIRIGFGSFVDKVALPYVSLVKDRRNNPCPSRIHTCQPAFSFQNILPLTSQTSEFRRKVTEQRISGNLDSPESGLDAIMQAAVCQDVIGWRNNTRILVYTSDDTFHIAGDGKLAGIYEPHDGKCHLNGSGFYGGKTFDYPSVGHLSKVLADNDIQLIFAVTEDIVPAYKALSKLLPLSVVGVLKNDSSNVVQLISEAYNNLSSAINLEQYDAPAGLDVSYQSHCLPGQKEAPWQTKGLCENVKINEQVNFTLRLNVSKCLKEKKSFYFKVQGITETLKVSVETLCDCQCGDGEESSQHCNNRGTLSCGVCDCNEGYLGQRCECEKPKDAISVDASCHQDNSSQLCSGHGSCECGKCKCQGNHHGNFCQCDNTNCPRHDNMLCAVDHSKDLPCSTDTAMYEVVSSEGNILVHYREIPKSIDRTYVIIGSSVSSIIFIGIAVILVTRLLLELHYRREYHNFMKAQQETDWKETKNPLFRNATTTILNPMYES
ncbi:integrin beta-7 [Aplochiton taeniatus]